MNLAPAVARATGLVQSRPEPLPVVSPSQIATFAMCERKWGWEYLEGIKPPPHRSAACGSRVHEILEHWLRSGTPPNLNEELVLDGHTYYPGAIALHGLHNLPPPGPHHDIEVAFHVPFVSGFPAQWRGRMDSAYEVLEPYATIGQFDIVEDVRGVPEILDHKTTSDLGYRKTPDDLKTDVQGLVYAHAAMYKTQAPKVNLRWVYYKTSKPFKSEVSFISLDQAHVIRELSLWEELATYPIRAKQQGKRALDMAPNPRACDRFGGCPHKHVRCKLSPGEVMVATMSADVDLMTKLQAMRTAQMNGGVPTAPPIGQITGAPAAPYMPPQAPPAYPQGPPAPWIVHPNDPNWLFNTQTQQFEQHTAENVAKLHAAAAPPAPPPPPPVQAVQQPPQQQMPMTAVQAQQVQYQPQQQPIMDQIVGAMAARSAAINPPVAPPLEQLRAENAAVNQAYAQHGVVVSPQQAQTILQHGQTFPPLADQDRGVIMNAIRAGALDSQILQHYPHAAPHLAQMRLEVQGPQRAMGINAPEGAATPPLAQPPAEPAAGSVPAGKDESMVGDQFDTMTAEQLRATAKANGMETGGKREKSLRIALRAHMQARGLAPAAPSIPQAVQQHLGQPPAPPAPSVLTMPHNYATLPMLPSAPGPITGQSLPTNGASSFVNEVRAILGDLNTIHNAYVAAQEKLHRLLGI